MRAIVLIALLFPALAIAATTKIEAGESVADTLQKLQQVGAVDITGGMAVVGPKGEWPLKGIYWETRDYDAVLEISSKKDGLAIICYWTKADFGESKSHRESARRYVQSVSFDSETKAVTLGKPRKK